MNELQLLYIENALELCRQLRRRLEEDRDDMGIWLKGRAGDRYRFICEENLSDVDQLITKLNTLSQE